MSRSVNDNFWPKRGWVGRFSPVSVKRSVTQEKLDYLAGFLINKKKYVTMQLITKWLLRYYLPGQTFVMYT